MVSDTIRPLVVHLEQITHLSNKACVRVMQGNFEAATDILQGQLTPLLQQVSQEVWLRHHRSGEKG